MSGKSFAVIGLGQFGMTLAKELANADYDVLAIDDKDENIQEIADTVTYAVRADVREPGILKSLGVQNVDVAIIAVAENMEASITATMQVKDLGVPLVLAKAMNSLHGRILEKIGADQVIYPERSMGIRVARNFTASGFEDVFELSTEFSMAEFRIPDEFPGLPSTIIYGIDTNGIAAQIAEAMKLRHKETLPVFIIADTFNRVVFVSQGYTIGWENS